jgi:16S rRNA (guanine966-N2)-methyltransferase
VRILAGEFKGRKLLSPPGRTVTRPITGSVKKSLFGMLGGCIEGASVLDLYCGTGTLGLEALSRGARRCIFADRDRAALDRLRRNIETVGVGDRCEVRCGDISRRVGEWLGGLEGTVDLAFVDPPYAHTKRWNWTEVGERIFTPVERSLISDGLLILRTPAGVETPDPLGGLAIRRVRRYGGMTVTIYVRGERTNGCMKAE